VGKLDGKVAVITGGSSGMALAGAKLFVEQGAHVFISARIDMVGRDSGDTEFSCATD